MKESAHIAYTHAKSCLMRKQPGNKFFDVSSCCCVEVAIELPKDVVAEGFNFLS